MQGQRAIVAVQWGPLQGRKAVLDPGASLRVGRVDGADLMVPHDRKMSGVHFEVAWDGSVCRVKDLASLGGTLIDGEPGKTEGVLQNGGWIKAGETVFTVHVEGATPPPSDEIDSDDEDADAETLAARAKAREELRAREAAAAIALTALLAEASERRLYAVLDAARAGRILQLLGESVEESRSLYEGVEGEVLALEAPYLVLLPPGSRLLTSLVREGWGKRWGIYLSTPMAMGATFKELRRHLRRFLLVEEEETGERLYFRFYDPATIRTFLPASTERQRRQLLGEARILYEDACGVLQRAE